MYEISTSNNYTADLNALITQQVCLTTALENDTSSRPFASFSDFAVPTQFVHAQVKSFLPIIEQLQNYSTNTTDAEKYADAYTVFTLFWFEGRFVSSGGGVGLYTTLPSTTNDFITRKNDKVNSSFPDIKDIYNRYFGLFKNSYGIFFP